MFRSLKGVRRFQGLKSFRGLKRSRSRSSLAEAKQHRLPYGKGPLTNIPAVFSTALIRINDAYSSKITWRPLARSSPGFSLIELMIVIAIVSVVSTFAIPAYQNYIVSANSTKLSVHYRQASNWVRAEMVRLQSRLIGGGDSAEISAGRDETSEWVNALLADVAGSETASPSSGAAFVPAAEGAAPDAITLSVSGTPLDASLGVTITRPIFGNFDSAEQTHLCWGGVACINNTE